MKNIYSIRNMNEHMAKAMGIGMPISTKMAIEICNYIRNRDLQEAKRFLADVAAKKRAVPLKRFNKNVGHKKGKIAAGRYPVKAAKFMLKLLEGVETNAQLKGLNTGSLRICHLVANRAAAQTRSGRQRGRETKSTHVEIVVEETAKKKEAKKSPKVTKDD